MAKHAAITDCSRFSIFVVCAFFRDHKCLIYANTCRFCSYNPPRLRYFIINSTQLSESCKGYHGLFMYYVFTEIFHYSLAVLNCASIEAEVWTS
ncbi:hypothetical protein T4A_6154 [Trichinella pseudospiralis]|nr:hypothetical protein T4E_8935 [Trichinella pseudospiralis]KRY76377.1 hypothetical protein T4A_6154 [Trichinella pseudospiralis]